MHFSAALLAGGRSTRMGRDKAWLDWHGSPLWRAQMEKLIALSPEKLIIAARAEQDFAGQLARAPLPAAITLVNDPAGEDCGPIGAITRCLRVSAGPLLVLAVDMPTMTTDFLRDNLLSVAATSKGAVPRGPNGYEALSAVYPTEALPLFESALAAGRYALQPLITELAAAGLCSVVAVRAEEEEFFFNANTPDEAARLLSFPNQEARA